MLVSRISATSLSLAASSVNVNCASRRKRRACLSSSAILTVPRRCQQQEHSSHSNNKTPITRTHRHRSMPPRSRALRRDGFSTSVRHTKTHGPLDGQQSGADKQRATSCGTLGVRQGPDQWARNEECTTHIHHQLLIIRPHSHIYSSS